MEKDNSGDGGTCGLTDRRRAHALERCLLIMGRATECLDYGKLADRLALDIDHMTIPVDDIRNTSPVMTMTGGGIVYGGKA